MLRAVVWTRIVCNPRTFPVPDAPVVRQQDVVPNAPPQGVQQRGTFDDWYRSRCTAADPKGRITYSNNPAPCNAEAAQAQERFPVIASLQAVELLVARTCNLTQKRRIRMR